MRLFFFDTETAGLPLHFNDPPEKWPPLVQLAYIVTDTKGNTLKEDCKIVRPEGFTIPQRASDVHGITTERALTEGLPLQDVLNDFAVDFLNSDIVVCHNYDFDSNIVDGEIIRLGKRPIIRTKPSVCTMLASSEFVGLPGKRRGEYKWPKLSELHVKLFGEDFDGAHDAMVDIRATVRCFFALKEQGVISKMRPAKAY